MRYAKSLFRACYLGKPFNFYLPPLLAIVLVLVAVDRFFLNRFSPVFNIALTAFFLMGVASAAILNMQNKRKTAGAGFLCIFLGIAINLLVISLNNWRMPITASSEEFLRYSLSPSSPLYVHFEQSNFQLLWLSDWVWFLDTRLSPGDLLALFGGILIVFAMMKNLHQERQRF